MTVVLGIFLLLLIVGVGFGIYYLIKKLKNSEGKEGEKFVPTTQDQLPIEYIRHGIVKLKRGGYRILIEIPSVNIDLMGDEQKEVILQQYARVLNSIDFPFQYLQQSRVVDVSEYIDKIDKQIVGTKNPFIVKQLEMYQEYISELVKDSSVLTKKIFFVVPFDEHREKNKNRENDKAKKKKKEKGGTKEENAIAQEEANFERARKQLYQRGKMVDNAFRRFGVNPYILGDEDLLDLFQTSYNKDRSVKQSLRGKDPSDYTTLYVKREGGDE